MKTIERMLFALLTTIIVTLVILLIGGYLYATSTIAYSLSGGSFILFATYWTICLVVPPVLIMAYSTAND